MGKKNQDEMITSDPNDPNFIRKLTPQEMELLKGGAPPGPSELPEWTSRPELPRRR